MVYRLYFMNEYSGHIDLWTEIEAADDASGMAQAVAHQGSRPIELWGPLGKVGRVEAIVLTRLLREQERRRRELRDFG